LTNYPKTRKLTVEETLRILSVAKRHSYSHWLIMRLIVEHGFKIGEIVGNSTRRNTLPGIKIKDLIRDEIVIRRALQKKKSRIPISSQLMRKLREHAGSRPLEELLFRDTRTVERQSPLGLTPFDTMRKRLKLYAVEAGVPRQSVSFQSLRNTLLPNQIGLVEFDGDIAGEAIVMADFYALNYCLERSIRKLIRETLEKYGTTWWEGTNPQTNSPIIPQTVKDYYLDTKKRERESDFLITRPGPQLEYITFGQLKEIINHNWKDLESKFLNGKAKPVFDALVTLNQLRPLIAHSYAFTDLERDKFRIAMNEWLSRLIAT
jgi:hypothetical protein